MITKITLLDFGDDILGEIMRYLTGYECLKIIRLNKEYYSYIMEKKTFRYIFRDVIFGIKREIKDFIFLKKYNGKFVRLNFNENKNITDKAFSYLLGLKELNMSGCNQDTITDKAFSYLSGIKKLNIDYSN